MSIAMIIYIGYWWKFNKNWGITKKNKVSNIDTYMKKNKILSFKDD